MKPCSAVSVLSNILDVQQLPEACNPNIFSDWRHRDRLGQKLGAAWVQVWFMDRSCRLLPTAVLPCHSSLCKMSSAKKEGKIQHWTIDIYVASCPPSANSIASSDFKLPVRGYSSISALPSKWLGYCVDHMAGRRTVNNRQHAPSAQLQSLPLTPTMDGASNTQ